MADEQTPLRRSRNYSRSKGCRAELEYVNKFKELGFDKCRTSREASRLLDACGIDLSEVPFNIQIKSGYRKNLVRADKVFIKMKEDLKKCFGAHQPVHTYPKFLIQKIDGYYAENQLVTMMWTDFVKLLEVYVKHKNFTDVQESKTCNNLPCVQAYSGPGTEA
jgi:hypothetical protein